MFKVNEYFEGKVKSIAFNTEEGPATVGVMAAGKYEFGTSTKEIMKVITGKLIIKFSEKEEAVIFKAGESFTVEKDKKFGVEVLEDTSYICYYK